MEVHFTPETEVMLAQAAAENHTGAAEYAQQLVERYISMTLVPGAGAGGPRPA